MATFKEQIPTLKKKLEEVQKAKDQVDKAKDEVEKVRNEAKQQGYDIGMAETEESLNVEVSRVCMNYCSQVWYEALNQAGVEVSSILRKPESVHYPLAIRPSIPTNSSTVTVPKVTEAGKDSPAEVLISSNKPSEAAEHPGATKKEKNTHQEMAPDAIKPPTST